MPEVIEKKQSPEKTAEAKPEPSQAVAEQPKPQPPKQWVMPAPCKGQPVIFYYRATVAERNSEVAFVTQVGERVIGVQFRGNGYDNVLHKDDPRLKLNPDLRNDIDGVWEQTDGDQRLEARLTAMEAEIDKLKELLK